MRFNSIVGAMFFIVMSSMLALSIFVQTRTFGNLMSRVITDISEKKANMRIAMNNIEISLFPPGVEMIKVSLEKTFSDGKRLEAELGKVGIYLGLIEIEERNFALGEVRISESVINYTFPEKDDAAIEKINDALIEEVFNYSQNLPLRVDTLLIENTLVHANHDLLNVRRLKLFKQKEHFTARFHISNIKPIPDSEYGIDEFWADAEITKKDIVFQRLRLQHDVHSLVIQGKVQNWPLLKKASIQLNGEGLFHLKALKNMNISGPVKVESGIATFNFHLNKVAEKVEAESNVVIKDLHSNVILADVLAVRVALQNDNLLMSGLEVRNGNQKVRVKNDVVLANFVKQVYLQEPIDAEVENLELANALRILGPSFKPLKGTLTGRLRFSHNNGNLYFLPANGFRVQNLALVVGDEKPFQVLKVKEAKVKDADFSLVNKDFRMSAFFELPDSSFKVEGTVGKGNAKFTVDKGSINLQDLGDIARLGILGKGELSIDVHGPLDNIDMDFKGKMAGFGVIGYQLGDADIDLSLGLKDSSVTIRKLESLYGKTHISGNGAINYKSLDIALGINASNANFHDLKGILAPILSKLNFLPPDLELNGNIDAYLHGKTNLPLLKLKSHVTYSDLFAYGESIELGSFDLGLQNEALSISNFEGKKENGSIEGTFLFNMPNEKLNLDFKWHDLNLKSFNVTKRLGLNFDAFMVGNIKGEGRVKDYTLLLKNELTETTSGNYKYPDSSLNIRIMPDHMSGKADFLGNIVQSVFDLSLTRERKSSIDLKVNMPDIKPLAVAFMGQHLEQEDFSGRVAFEVESSFEQGFNHLNLKGRISDLFFTHDTFNVNYASKDYQFLIEDSRLINWNLNIREPDLYIITRGEGTFGKEVSITNEFHVNSKIAELFLSNVLSAEGVIKNVVRIEGKGDEYNMTASSSTEKLSVSIEGAPFALNEVKYLMDYSNKRLIIRELITNLESGTVSVMGDVIFNGETPDVNIKYQLERAEIPVLGKSSVNLTGEGIILGNDLPYNLGGEITVNKANIVNELTDFSNKSVAQVRYLPKSQESVLGKLFNININVKIENPARITNSLMDVALKGELRLFGSPARPRGEGRIFSPINTSRIFFKNNEYFLSNADINFSPKKEISNPDFDVQAITFISNYKVNAKAYGDLERFNFDLTSDPPLPRNSILSLIAFGYTDEIQSQLTQGEQQNLTQVGVGSFVFDRFKISDILNKQFGLQVNLGTVFEQSQTQSMLSGRTQEGQGTLGRTRSATKIELKKRLDEALTLSVSSTMGGSIGQRQSMNLTYSVNKKVQLEGVYELRTNAEGEEDIIDNSIGGDLKFRWTFK